MQIEMEMRRHIDPGSLFVMALTFVLFVVALFVKGLGHDLLLEAGVFLVSVKLIIMSYKNAVASQRVQDQLALVLSILQRQGAAGEIESPADGPGDAGPDGRIARSSRGSSP